MSDAAQIVRTVRVEHESGAWAEIKANRSRAVGQALAMNRYWRDLAPVLAPLIRDWGGFTIEVLETEGVPALMSDDGERELLPARTIGTVVEKTLPAPCGDPQPILDLADADPDLATWLALQAILAPKTFLDQEKKDGQPPETVSGQPEPTPDGTPDSAAISPILDIYTRPNRRTRSSSSRPALSTSA